MIKISYIIRKCYSTLIHIIMKVTKDGGVSHGNNFTSRIIKKALWKRAEYHQSLERYIFSSCQR